MDEFIDVLHSFNVGDLVTVLCGLRELSELKQKKVRVFQRIGLEAHYYDGQINSTVNQNGEGVCVNKRLFEMLKPLVLSQGFVADFEVFTGQKIHYNFDLTRDSRSVAMPAGSIHSWYQTVFPEMNSDPSKTWLTITPTNEQKERYKDKILVNRTRRYNNPYINYYFLKPYQDRVIFSGTDEEFIHFCNEWDLQIEKDTAKDFYELAQIIKSVKFGIYNQSAAFHIADAIKANRILELCTSFPNTFINGSKGCQFYHQAALEYYYKKLMNG